MSSREVANYFSRKSVLVVEDERFSRLVITAALQACGIPNIGEAGNVAQAVNHLGLRDGTSGGYDAAIIDFELPGQHGLFLLQQIRMGMTAAPRRLPVVVVTSHADPDLVLPAMALDVSAFIRKPIDQPVLSQRLYRSMTRAFEPKASARYSAVELVSLRPKTPRLFQSTGRPSHIAAQPEEGMVLTPLDQIEPGAKLARPLQDPVGRELVPAHYVLSGPVIVLLEDLTSFEPSYGKVWVAEAEAD